MRRSIGLAALLLALSGCGAAGAPAVVPSASAPASPSPTATGTGNGTGTGTASPTAPPLGTVPPAWLGTRPLPRTADGFGVQEPTPPGLRNRRFTLPDTVPSIVRADGAFNSTVVDPAPSDVIARSTWAPGCPVAATDLAWIKLTFWGFDHRAHTGELLVNHDAVDAMLTAFKTLYDERFPLEQMVITDKAAQNAAPTGDGNDTGSFNCRPVRGQTVFSQHAYGRAVDVNPFQNPYEKGDLVLPELAGAYTDRSWKRPGMILPDGPVVRAFAAVGWTWGGSWHSLKDLQHFSANGT